MTEKKSESFANLAYKILKENEKPMNYKDITKEILKIKKTKGKTPDETIRVKLAKDSRFIRFNRGIYGLKEMGERSTAS